MDENTLFIVLMGGEFNTFHRRIHVSTMAKAFFPAKILVINRPIDPLVTLIKKRYRYKETIIKKLYPNMYLLSPIMPLYDQLILNSPNYLKTLNYMFFNYQIKKLLKTLGWDKYKKILWSMHPDLNDYINQIKPDKVIFDMYDQFIVKTATKGILEREKNLITQSDLTINISRYLREKKLPDYPTKSFINIPNGIDFSLFHKSDFSIPNEFLNIPKPIIGYVGNIKRLIDIDLVKFLVNEKSNYSFVFIGAGDNIEELDSLPNTYFLGNIRYEKLPEYLNAFDIGFIPYKVENPYSLAISPMKLYEYLAANLYVVSNPIPDVIDFQKIPLGQKKVAVANTKEEFLEKIDYFLTLPKEKISEEELYSISWDQRFEKIKEKMIELKII